MKSKFIIIFLFILLFIPNTYALTDYSYLENDLNIPYTSTKNILLYNLDDEKIVYAKNSSEKISIASLTKIMTVLVSLEKIDNLDEEVVVSNNVLSNLDGYAKAGFKGGDKVTYKDLLYGLLLPSGADAATTLAILTYNDEDSFVKKMNELAIKLKMNDTHYNNPIGKDNEDNYSTLNDLLKLLKYALNNKTFYEIYTTRYYKTSNNLELKSTLVEPSLKYNLDIESIKGSKSGFTSNAGLCLSSIASINGINYLLITTGSNYTDGLPNHIIDSLTIYNYFKDNFSYQLILKKDEVIKTLEIKDSFKKTYDLKSNEDIYLYLPNNQELNYNYEGINNLNNKIKVNDKLGEIQVLYKDKVIYTDFIYLNEKIKYKHTKFFIMISLVLLIVISFIVGRKIKNKSK